MAYGGQNSWDLLCPVCKTFIETNCFDDLQASIDFHYLNMHSTLRSKFQSSKHEPILNKKNATRAREACTNYLICPVCDRVVEITRNNINHCLMEHFEICHQQVDKLGSVDCLTVQHSTDVFKNNDNILNLKHMAIQPCKSFDLSPDLDKHRGYITLNNNHFLCHICKETLNTDQMVEYHLKTKRHEDNVIVWLKGKLSIHMQISMEYVSFYGSNLCCNLCRCKIDMNSLNPQETLLNIISHNADTKHSQSKFLGDPKENNAKLTMFKSITEKNVLINEHQEFIETVNEPRFRCTLCEKTINFSNNHIELEQNFLIHIKGLAHSKNSKAIKVLRFFKEMNGDKQGFHCFSISNGNINCTRCNCIVTANLDQLLEHCESSKSKTKESTPLPCEKPLMNKRNNFPSHNKLVAEMTPNTLKNPEVSQTVRPKDTKTKQTMKLNIKEILQPLKNQFGNITCIAENEEGKLTCLICNCLVQPSTHCVKMHMTGKFHKNKTQCQIKQLDTLTTNTETRIKSNLESGSSLESYHVLLEHLFQSLPQRFQDDKDFCTVNLSDGSLNCMLCGCTIDPMYIQDHLQEETHYVHKQLYKGYNNTSTK